MDNRTARIVPLQIQPKMEHLLQIGTGKSGTMIAITCFIVAKITQLAGYVTISNVACLFTIGAALSTMFLNYVRYKRENKNLKQ